MRPDMRCEVVVLLVLIGGVVEGRGTQGQPVDKTREQKVDEGLMVEDAVDIGAHASGIDEVAIGRAVGEAAERRGSGPGDEQCETMVNLIAGVREGVRDALAGGRGYGRGGA